MDKANEYLNILYYHWFKLIFHYFNLLVFYYNSLGQNNIAYKINFIFMKLTLIQIDIETLFFRIFNIYQIASL